MPEQADITEGKLLVVDDDEDMLNLLSKWLAGSGYSVTTAIRGADALGQVEISKPDLVITDLFMDEMDGMALLTKIHNTNPLIPVIMLSGQAQIPDAVKATHLGTAAFLTKPIEKTDLLANLELYVRRHVGFRSKHSVRRKLIVGRPNAVYRPDFLRYLLIPLPRVTLG